MRLRECVIGAMGSMAVRRAGLVLAGTLGVSTLGGCYGSYSYSYSTYRPCATTYYEPACPPRVVVRETYCAPAPVIIVDHHHSHDHGGYHGGYRGGRRW